MEEKERTSQILDYLYRLEFFSPFTPNGKQVYDSKSKKEFHFPSLFQEKETKHKQTIYTIYIGLFNYKYPIEKINQMLNLEAGYKEIGKTESTICGFKIDQKGKYLSGTFSISSFVYAVNKILNEHQVSVNLEELELNNIQSKIESDMKLTELDSELEEKNLQAIFNLLKTKFPFISENFNYHFQIFKEEIYNQAELEESTPAILSSFYVNDLKMIKNNFDDKIIKLLSLKTKQQIEIDKDVDIMKKVLSPKNYPLGKWPSKYSPCLMQQLAINLAIERKEPIFSVNGPPGSGKTTLVKEIIASYIVERAKQMVNYEKSDDAFQKRMIENPSDRYHTSFYQLDEKLSKYGILIASNNNNAVENISLELPLAKGLYEEKTLTDLFDVRKKEEIYFTDLANDLLENNDAWGLISIRLGRKENIQKFLQAIWFSKESNNKLKDYRNHYENDYQICKNNFSKKLKEVENYQKFLENVKGEVEILETLQEDISKIKSKINQEQEKLKTLEQQLEEIEKEIVKKEKQEHNYETLLKEVKKKIPIYMRLLFFLFKNHPYRKKEKELSHKILEGNQYLFELKEKKITLELEIENQKEVIGSQEEKLKVVLKQQEELEKKIKIYQKQNGIIVADSKYYEKIETNQPSQEKSPWTSKEYDKLREELFFEALKLHKSFILSSSYFYSNISLLVDVLNGKADLEEKKNYYSALLNTLFLFTPVISTTLASVSKFLEGIPENSIGNLIIDEAGQATPASVIGAIYRSRNVVVLGDPFQVEPVVTIPKEFYKILDNQNKLPFSFHDSTLSCQILADSQNPYGGKRNSDNPIWVGCPLLLHRRCMNPMFTISNKIAYDDKMFYCTNEDIEDKKLVIEKSAWIDIKGEEISSSNHYVKEQGEKVLELVEAAINLQNGFPSLYIISPFKSVATEMRNQLIQKIPKLLTNSKKEIEDWVTEHCGTIHTFQGKETDEVIILLGCSKKSSGAIRWAGEKPNILNVALTRAKYRVVIIGDVTLWKDVPNFSTAYEYLDKS